jgi:hypothetical protein
LNVPCRSQSDEAIDPDEARRAAQVEDPDGAHRHAAHRQREEGRAGAAGEPEIERPEDDPDPARRRGEECTLRIPGVCNRDPATTVLCHSNRLADGKGMGLKAPDSAACFACHACHDVLDGRRPLPANLTREQLNAGFDAAVVRTHARLREKGIEVCNP